LNCDSVPLSKDQFKWKTQNYGLESLLISRDEF